MSAALRRASRVPARGGVSSRQAPCVIVDRSLRSLGQGGDGAKAKVQVYTLTPEERAQFVARTAGGRDTVKAKSASVKATVELIEKGLAEFRAKSKKK